MPKNHVYLRTKNYCFSPRLLPTLLVLGLLPLLVSLGFWQIHRGSEKNQIQQLFNLRSRSIAIDLNHTHAIDLTKNYASAKMQGHFDNQQIYLLDNRIYQHKIGYEVLTPFILKNSPKVILVNRGWIPQGLNRKKIPPIPLVKGKISIQGLIVFPGKNFSFKQAAEKNWPQRIQTVNPHFLHQHHLSPFLFVINTKQNYSFIPLWKPVSFLASRHYAYAFQWFGLSLTLFIAFFSTQIRRL